MSSASKSSFVIVTMFIACSASSSSGIWPLNSGGVSPRVPLYSGVLAVAEREARDVERHAEVGRLLFLQQQDQHRQEAVDRVGVLPVAGHEAVDRQGVERPERERMAVDEQEGRLFGVRHGPAYPPVPTPSRRVSVTKLPPDLDPELYRAARRHRRRRARRRRWASSSSSSRPSYSVARMPVAGNTQVVGLLHGGAHVVLGESLGSISSAIHGGPGQVRRRHRDQRDAQPLGHRGLGDRHLHARSCSAARSARTRS